MTALGYGDTSPRSTGEKNWVVLQEIIGQFYIAILVARLVGVFSAQVKASE